MGSSYLKDIKITNFRAIKELHITPGRRITLFTGKNGTAKSTILGMIAQPFSFNSNVILGYSEGHAKQKQEENPELLKEVANLKTIYNRNFESNVNDHFKLSTLDAKGEDHAFLEFYDHLHKTNINLKIGSNDYEDRKGKPRLVTRKDRKSTIQNSDKDSSSSNEIFPVVYQGLRRVFPIVQVNENQYSLEFSDEEKRYLRRFYNQILLNDYPENYKGTNVSQKRTFSFVDETMSLDMISSGEDNVGQILGALLSFRRLKENYKNYSGGILLIDEIDATLYPAAQKQLINILIKEARALDLQVYMSSHSMFLIEHVLNLKENKVESPKVYKGDIEVVALKKAQGYINSAQEVTYESLWQDLHEESRAEEKPKKIRVYFEDKEAEFMFKSIIRQKKFTKKIESIDVSLGCDKYIELHKKKIPEFTSQACVVLDGEEKEKVKKIKNFTALPGSLPPEQLIYRYIMEESSPFWEECNNDYNFHMLMSNPHNSVIKEILEGDFDNQSRNESGGEYFRKKPREVWKMWFNEEKKNWYPQKNNPFTSWARHNSELMKEFEEDLKTALNVIAIKNEITLID